MTVEDNVLPGINERLHPAEGQAVATPCVFSHLFWAVVVGIAVYFDSEPGSDQDVDPVAQIGAGLDLCGERGDSCLPQQSQRSAFEDAWLAGAGKVAPTQSFPERCRSRPTLSGYPPQLRLDATKVTSLLASALSTASSMTCGGITAATSMTVRSGAVHGMFRTVAIWAGNSLGRCTSQPAGRLDTTRGTVMACLPGASIIRHSHAADWWDATAAGLAVRSAAMRCCSERLVRAREPESLGTEPFPLSRWRADASGRGC